MLKIRRGIDFYWHLVGRSQGCYRAFYNAQASTRPPEQRVTLLNMSRMPMLEISLQGNEIKVGKSILGESLERVTIKEAFPGSASVKEPTCQCRKCGFGPWAGKVPGEGQGNPPQYSCQENTMDRRAWQVQSTGSHRAGHG